MKNITISLICLTFLTLISTSCFSQEDKTVRPSPPAGAKGTVEGGAVVTIKYSTPSVKGRKIWGELVPYGKVWRTGANEATIFETDKDVLINGSPLPAGKYALFSIPGEKEWKFIFNSVWDQWGAFNYDPSKDVLTADALPKPSSIYNEKLAFDITDNSIILSWENLSVAMHIKTK